MAERVAERIPVAASPSTEPTALLPSNMEAELEALAMLNDDVLWAVARSRMNSPTQRRWQRLLEKNQQEVLSDLERQELARLTDDGDRLTLCKAHAYLILKQRGHRIPELDRRH